MRNEIKELIGYCKLIFNDAKVLYEELKDPEAYEISIDVSTISKDSFNNLTLAFYYTQNGKDDHISIY